MTEDLKLPRLARDLRAVQFELRAADDGSHTLTFAASSDLPLERFFGTEILSHDASAIRMARIEAGAAPLLFNHNWDDPVGMLTGGRIADGRLVVDARLFSTARAREVKAMLDGGLRNVSIGYEIHEMFEEPKANRYTATDWEPFEVSIVTVPADPSVGIGRASEQVSKPVRVTRAIPSAQPAKPVKEDTMSEQQAPVAGTPAVEVRENGTLEQRAIAAMSAVDLEAARKNAIRNLCKGANLEPRFADNWIHSGKSLETVAEEIVQVVAERSKDTTPAGIGMSRKEADRYSITKALRAALSKDWSKAGLELEAHKAVMAAHGVTSRSGTSFFVPMEIQARAGLARRDMTVAGVSGSNYLVSTDNLSGSFIDLLRNDSVVLGLGATRLTGLVGNITIPRMTAGGTAYWLADETTQITESQATIGQVSLSPKNVAALTEISHQLMQQSSPDVESMVMNDLAQVLALAVDVATLRGSGLSGQPHGIVGTSGVGAFDTDGTDTFSDVLNAQVDVMAANALRDGCAYVADAASAALLMGRSRFASTDTPIWNGSLLSGTMAGFPCRASNQMSANTMLFGLWPSIIVAEWGQLELMVNPYSDFTRGLSAVRAWYAMDTAMRYPAAFSYDASVA